MDVLLALQVYRRVANHIVKVETRYLTVVGNLLAVRLHVNHLCTIEHVMIYRIHLIGQQGVYPQIAAVLEIDSQHGIHICFLGIQSAFIEQRAVFQEDVCQ